MCTMSWFLREDGYELFFNRDEQRSRSCAHLPELTLDDNKTISYIAPTDADAGGTWIAVNEQGVTVCLLNHYQFEQPVTYQKWLSRGEIVRQFANTLTLVQAEALFQQVVLSDYRAFRLFILMPDGTNRLFVWDGHQQRIEREVTAPKSSSSVDAREVKSLRKQYFSDLQLQKSTDRQQFLDYHTSHYPDKSKKSVCMHRDDANSVSLSHIVVTHDVISFAYANGAPCVEPLNEPLTLARVASVTQTGSVSLHAVR